MRGLPKDAKILNAALRAYTQPGGSPKGELSEALQLWARKLDSLSYRTLKDHPPDLEDAESAGEARDRLANALRAHFPEIDDENISGLYGIAMMQLLR